MEMEMRIGIPNAILQWQVLVACSLLAVGCWLFPAACWPLL